MQMRSFKERLEQFEEQYPEAPVKIQGNGEPSTIHIEERDGYETIIIKTGTKF